VPPSPPNFPPPPPNQQAPWSLSGQRSRGSPPRKSKKPIVIVAVIASVVILAVGGYFTYLRYAYKHAPTDTFAKKVADYVSEKDGFTLTGMSCPSDFEPKVGLTFDCHFNGFKRACTAHVTPTRVVGNHIDATRTWGLDKW
jgi:hypothetical protein